MDISNLQQLNTELLQAAQELQLKLPQDCRKLSICKRIELIREALFERQQERLTKEQSQTITRLLEQLGNPAKKQPLPQCAPLSLPPGVLGIVASFTDLEEAQPALVALGTTFRT